MTATRQNHLPLRLSAPALGLFAALVLAGCGTTTPPRFTLDGVPMSPEQPAVVVEQEQRYTVRYENSVVKTKVDVIIEPGVFYPGFTNGYGAYYLPRQNLVRIVNVFGSPAVNPNTCLVKPTQADANWELWSDEPIRVVETPSPGWYINDYTYYEPPPTITTLGGTWAKVAVLPDAFAQSMTMKVVPQALPPAPSPIPPEVDVEIL